MTLMRAVLLKSDTTLNKIQPRFPAPTKTPAIWKIQAKTPTTRKIQVKTPAAKRTPTTENPGPDEDSCNDKSSTPRTMVISANRKMNQQPRLRTTRPPNPPIPRNDPNEKKMSPFPTKHIMSYTTLSKTLLRTPALMKTPTNTPDIRKIQSKTPAIRRTQTKTPASMKT